MPERTLTVRIVGDDADLRRAFARSEKGAATFSGRVSGATAGVTKNFLAAGVAAGATAVSFQAVTAAISQSVSNASNLAEQISKSRQVFGDSSTAIEAWSQTTARALGIARGEAIGFAGSLGNMFTAMGLGKGQAAEMSVEMVQLAADMASFSNEDPSAMLERIRSGLAGEMEPLRRFGSILSATRVSTFAWANGIAKAGETLTEQQKILARYGLLLQDTKVQQGNFALTSGGLANQTRILKAQFSDLSTNLGGVLVPVLTDAAEAANLLFAALNQMRGIDFSPGFDFPDIPDFLSSAAAIAPISPAGAVAFGFKKAFDDAEKEAKDVGSKGFGGIGEDIVRRAEEDAKAVVRAAADVKSAQTRAQKAFRELALGLGLKLDKAGLTDSTTDDIAVLRELERAVLRQIDREGKTFKLVNQLTQTRLAISGLVAQNTQAAADAVRDAFDDTLDSLSLKLDIAGGTESIADDLAILREIEQTILRRIEVEGRTAGLLRQLFQARKDQADLKQQAVDDSFSSAIDSLGLNLDIAKMTKSFTDDMAVLRKIEQTIVQRIQAEGRTTDLLRQLFQVRQDQADVRRQMAENARTRRQEDQFEALGLTEEGDKRTPGAGALRSRAARLEDQVKGTALDTPRTRQMLQNIGNVLAGEYGKLGRKVRQAILEMLNDITSALDDQGATGNLTAHRITDPTKILQGLGLSPEELDQLYSRLISQGSGGAFRTTPGQGAFGFSTFGMPGSGGFQGPVRESGGIVVTGPITVVSDDPDEMGRKLGKKARRAVKSRGGRFAGNRGL